MPFRPSSLSQSSLSHLAKLKYQNCPFLLSEVDAFRPCHRCLECGRSYLAITPAPHFLKEILDNITSLLGDDPKRTVTPGKKLHIGASCFSIYAYEALKAELELVASVEFIFTSSTFVHGQANEKMLERAA
jgi:hypothetical protein